MDSDAWPAHHLEERPTESLTPNPRNSKRHPPEQVEYIGKLLDEYGWTSRILIRPDGTIIAGEGRWLAAQLRGIKAVPVMVAQGWSEAQERAYIIADNRSVEMGEWDRDALKGELMALEMEGFDLGLTGFDLADFGPAVGHTEPDTTIAPPKNPVTVVGDLWLLGEHRLLCGDSTDAEDVARLFGERQPNLMVTDPPYGVEYDPNWRNSAERSTKIKGRKIGATAVGKVQNDGRADWQEAWALFPGATAYVWHAGLNADVVAGSLKRVGFEIRSQIIWNKRVHIIGRGDYHWKHEPCWYAVRKGARGFFNRGGEDGRKQNTVWDIDHRASETGHSTQKPVECMAKPIRNNSKSGEAVYDPFMGSGSTIIAAEMERRVAVGVDIDPAYVDVAVLRWQAFTGKEARLEGGATFAQVTAERLGAGAPAA